MKLFVVCVVLAAVLMAPAILAVCIEDGELSATFNCDSGNCWRTCVQGGWISGYCQGDNCVCSGKIKTYNVQRSSPNSIPNETPMDKPIKADCETVECIVFCQKMHKIGGRCVAGRCWCF